MKTNVSAEELYHETNSVSASGARFTDDREYVWWERGETAVLENRGESGEFRVIFTGNVPSAPGFNKRVNRKAQHAPAVEARAVGSA